MFCASQELQGLKLQNPMYIGKSMNLNRRFKDHVRRNENIRELRNCFKDNLEFCFIKITGEIDTDSLGLLEQNMIDCFGPQFNEINSVSVVQPLNVILGDPIKI
jgi:excinuclease UvrABC nuclease subunit